METSLRGSPDVGREGQVAEPEDEQDEQEAQEAAQRQVCGGGAGAALGQPGAALGQAGVGLAEVAGRTGPDRTGVWAEVALLARLQGDKPFSLTFAKLPLKSWLAS